MTGRQRKLLEELPKNNNVLSRSAIRAGYTANTANKNIYTLVRKSKGLKEYFNENTVKKDIRKAKRLCLKNKKGKPDLTNYLRATELESKILGMQKDVSESNVNIVTQPEEIAELALLRKGIFPVNN